MGEFCSQCGVEVGFFSRKRVQLPDGALKVFCKACASRRTAALSAVMATPDSAPPPAPPSAPAPVPLAIPDGPGAAVRIARHLVATFRAETGVDLSGDAMAMDRVSKAAERAAAELDSAPEAEGETEVSLPFLTADATGPKHLLVRINRRQLG